MVNEWFSNPRCLSTKCFIPKIGATIEEIVKFGAIDTYSNIHDFYHNGKYVGLVDMSTGIKLNIKKIKKGGALREKF